MALPSLPKPLRRIAWIAPVVLLGHLGCQRTIDAASLHDPSLLTTTIPYTGVREPTRQFPDYSSIDASILDKNATAPAKKGAPR
ncbi:MAG: hypothetical protein HUU21_12080 [Polyangiaceae bacterium]|nr:hypothetical protein [Polyangiaceae bacterium]NUQ74287.1 hypothetical protein [Polyangiaceae bacterium]